MVRDGKARIDDILAAIADIRSDTCGMDYTAFARSPTVVRSILYSIGIIGEAAKNLSPELKDAHPEIPWRAIAGIRDRIVHEYFRTNTRRIWDVVTEDLDPLEAALHTICDQGRR
ncbi:MAG: DUF86 domain-containing protein [Magnetospirillum sp.]|nr:DUF86 domain-containing protein [Magnetospirillum sp.]